MNEPWYTWWRFGWGFTPTTYMTRTGRRAYPLSFPAAGESFRHITGRLWWRT